MPTTASEPLLFSILVNKQLAYAELDSAAIDRNCTFDGYISSALVSTCNIHTVSSDVSVRLADGSLVTDTRLCTVDVSLGELHSKVTLCVIPLGHSRDVLLGKTWLARQQLCHDLKIDYVYNTVTFMHNGTIHTVSASVAPGLAPQVSAATIDRYVLPTTKKKTSKLIKQIKKYKNGEAYLLHATRTDSHHNYSSSSPHCAAPWSAPSVRQRVATVSSASTTPHNQLESNVLSEYSDVFPEDFPNELPPQRSISHAIPLITGKQPPSRPPYRLSFAELDVLKAYLDDLLSKGLLQPSTSPYGAPVIVIKQKDKFRVCIDYRALNAQSIKNACPLPRQDDLFDRLHSATIFSKIDLRSGYHQVRVDPADTHKTAINTRYGHFEFTVLPFGLCNAPGTFQSLMNDVFKDFLDDFLVVYMDDLLIYSNSVEEHAAHVRRVLQRLREHKLYAKQGKCELFRTQVEFLGHILQPGHISVDPRKLPALRSWPIPSTVYDIRQFLGLCNYFRKFIKDFSSIAAPLTELTSDKAHAPGKNGKLHEWTPTHQVAFTALKTALTSPPVLAIPNGKQPFIVQSTTSVATDASDKAVGAVLLQEGDDGKQRVVAYHSRKLSPADQNYTVRDRELLAIHDALRTWRPYLSGFKFTVHSDHRTLQTFLSQKGLSAGRTARWFDFFADFDFDVQYRPGTSPLMCVPDALSRMTFEDKQCEAAAFQS